MNQYNEVVMCPRCQRLFPEWYLGKHTRVHAEVEKLELKARRFIAGNQRPTAGARTENEEKYREPRPAIAPAQSSPIVPAGTVASTRPEERHGHDPERVKRFLNQLKAAKAWRK